MRSTKRRPSSVHTVKRTISSPADGVGSAFGAITCRGRGGGVLDRPVYPCLRFSFRRRRFKDEPLPNNSRHFVPTTVNRLTRHPPVSVRTSSLHVYSQALRKRCCCTPNLYFRLVGPYTRKRLLSKRQYVTKYDK